MLLAADSQPAALMKAKGGGEICFVCGSSVGTSINRPPEVPAQRRQPMLGLVWSQAQAVPEAIDEESKQRAREDVGQSVKKSGEHGMPCLYEEPHFERPRFQTM